LGIGLRLGLTLCVPHKCHCGALVDAQGLHGFVCKKAVAEGGVLKVPAAAVEVYSSMLTKLGPEMR